MADGPSPWEKRPDAPAPPDHRFRFLLWIALLLAGAVGLMALAQAYPRSFSDIDSAWLIQYVALAALLSASLVFARQFSFGQFARNVAIWIGVIAVIVLGYTFQDELSAVWTRVADAFSNEPVATGPREMTINATENGDFYVYADVNGVRTRFAVDTGSSSIVLSPGDARRLGIDTTALTFDRPSETANGVGYSASYLVSDLTIGPLALHNVPVEINQAPMPQSLLGMTFLNRLKSFEFHGNKLVLRW